MFLKQKYTIIKKLLKKENIKKYKYIKISLKNTINFRDIALFDNIVSYLTNIN